MSHASKSLQKLQSPLGKGGRWQQWGGTHVDGYCAPFTEIAQESGFMLWMEWQMGLEETRYSPESRVWQAKASEFPLYLGVATPWNRSEGHWGWGWREGGGTHGGATHGGTPDACPPVAPEKLFTVHLRIVHLGKKGTKLCPAALISGLRSTLVGSIICPALLVVYMWGLHNFPCLLVSREARNLRSKHEAVGGRGRVA